MTMHIRKGTNRILSRLISTQACLLLIAAGATARGQNAPAPASDANPPASASVTPPAPQVTPVPAPAAAAEEANQGEKVVLSPFEVVSDTRGYYTANTESGTRINSKLDDLGAAISIVSKQQMSDFAMLDINDVFLYAGNTLGAGTYTANTVDRNGSVADSNQLNNTQANLIRGVAPANQARDDFAQIGRVPLDPINIDAVEISRGPNGSVFGLGNPSGTVNVVSAKANLSHDFTTVTVRGDSYGGYRTSLDINRVITPNLAFRVGLVGEGQGFERKPSGLDDTRYDGMLTYKPFKWTTLQFEYDEWRESGNRPNDVMPRDSVSYWLQSGKPTWDPVTQTITLNGHLVANTSVTPNTTTFPTATGVPDYFNSSFTGSTRSQVFVTGTGAVAYWSAPTTFSNTLGPISGTQGDRYVGASPAAGTNLGLFTGQPLFATTPSLSGRSIYDYTDMNFASINRTADQDKTYEATLDQIIFDSQIQQLTAQIGFFEEDSQRYQRNIDSTLNANGQSGELLIDVNQRNLDGTPNPFFLAPYIGEDQPITLLQPARYQTYRAQIAYKLDLTQTKSSWLRWLGEHTISAYDEYKYDINRQYAFKDVLSSAEPWVPAGLSRGNQGAITNGPAAALATTRNYFRYYVGGPNGTAQMQYAPANFSYGNYDYVWGNATTGVFNYAPAGLSQAAVTDSTGGSNNIKTILKTMGAVMQSHWLDDDLVTTIGEREDKQYQKYGSTPQLLNPDGISLNYASVDSWAAGDYNFNSGKTTQTGAVLRPFKDLRFLQRMATQDDGVFGFIAQTLGNTEFFFNKSNSFLPQNFATNDFLQPLPNTNGDDLEYGMSTTLFNGKLNIRVNRYEMDEYNSRNGNASTFAQRVLRMDVASTACFLLQTQALLWVAQLHPTYTTTQIDNEVGNEMGIPWATQQALVQGYNGGTIASSQNLTGNGTEVEINYNPTPFWTVSANASDTVVINSNVSQDITNWIALRMPIWTTIVDPRSNALWWTTNYGGSQTAQQNFLTFIQSPFSIIQQQQGTANPEVPQYNFRISTNFQLAGITNNPILSHFNIGGAVRWQSSQAIGYYGLQQLPATITQLNVNAPIYYSAQSYWDGLIGYRTRLFNNKVPTMIQLNVRNIQSGGAYLQPIAAYPSGVPDAYRIVDPRQYILTVTFNL